MCFCSQLCRRWWPRWGPRWRLCSCVWLMARPSCRRSAAPACERQAAHNNTMCMLHAAKTTQRWSCTFMCRLDCQEMSAMRSKCARLAWRIRRTVYWMLHVFFVFIANCFSCSFNTQACTGPFVPLDNQIMPLYPCVRVITQLRHLIYLGLFIP